MSYKNKCETCGEVDNGDFAYRDYCSINCFDKNKKKFLKIESERLQKEAIQKTKEKYDNLRVKQFLKELEKL